MILQVVRGLKARAGTAWYSSRVLGSMPEAVRFALSAKHSPLQVWKCRANGLDFVMRWSDWPAVQEVLIEHEYQVIAECLKGRANPLVLDLGANIGTFSLFVFRHFPKAKVVAYEASPATFALLETARTLNPQLDWQVHQAAVWSEDGQVNFDTMAFSPGSRVTATGGQAVRAIGFTAVMASLPGRIDLAKVDIEGAEEAVLAGREAELERIEHLIVELHPGRCDTDRVMATLQKVYPHIHAIPGRKSSKPLLLCAKRAFSLPVYQARLAA